MLYQWQTVNESHVGQSLPASCCARTRTGEYVNLNACLMADVRQLRPAIDTHVHMNVRKHFYANYSQA